MQQNAGRFSFQAQPIEEWYELNKDRFDPVISTGDEAQDQINLDQANNLINSTYETEVWNPANQAYRDSITSAYDQEVYQPYAESFDAYRTSFDTYKSELEGNLNRFLREVNPVAFNAAMEANDFSVTSQSVTGQMLPGPGFNLLREERKTPVLIDDQISTRAIYNASDLLGGLSVEDGSIDEYLNTEIDEEFLQSTRESTQADLDAAKLRKDSYIKSLRSVPMGDSFLAEIDAEIKDLEARLDESGDLSESYISELRALTLKKFMNANLAAQVNRIAEIKGIEKGTEEYRTLAMDVEAEVFGTSVVGGDFQQIQDAFKGTAVAPNMFKFMLDEDNVIGEENKFWEDAVTSWDIGVIELEKQLDALDTALGVDAQPTYTSTPYGSPVLFTARTEEEQAKRQEDHLERRKQLEAKQYELQLQLSQYAIDAKTWDLFGEDAISAPQDALSRGLFIQEEIGRQIQSDIERTYRLEAIQSMPVSLAMMAPGLALAPLTGGMSAAATFATTSIPTFAFTTAMVGSDRYYGTMLMEGGIWENMTPEDRFWHSLRYGMYEGIGEGLSAGTVGVAGKFLKGTRCSPYAATPYRVGTSADTFYRIGRGAAGITLATGVGVVEETAAEYVTGFGQGFDTALMEGKPMSEAFLEGKEMGSHGANVGKYMGFLPGGSVLVEQTKAAYLRKFNNKEYNDVVSVTAMQQFMNDAVPARTRKRLEDLRSQLSEAYLTTPTKADREILAKIEVELNKIDSNNEATRKALESLGDSNPALVADALIANNYHQFLENVRIGGGTLDANGKLRDWNGRFVSTSNNPMYDFAQNMSDEGRSKLQQAYNNGGKRSQQITQGFLTFFSGDRKIGIDSFGGLVTTQGQDWRTKGFEGAREIMVNGDQEIDLSAFTAAEIKVLQNFIDQAKKSGRKVSIVLHNDESLAYINEGGVRSENELLTEGLYMERPDGSHEIHIHEETDINRVAFHEYTHFFLESLFESNPEMVYDLAEQIRGLKSERVQELVKAADMQGVAGDRGTTDRELVSALLEAVAMGEFVRSENPIEGFQISDLGVSAVLRNAFSKITGFPDATTDSDLINLVLRFKNFAEGGQLGQVYTTPDQVDAARDVADIESGAPLASKRQYLENVEIFWTQNPYTFGEVEVRVTEARKYDSKRSKVFNDYRHFANWYRKMTGNGSREGIISDIHFFRDGKRFNLNYPKKLLNKDGSPVFMKAAMLLPKERKWNDTLARIDTGTEISVKQGSLAQEASRIHGDHFTNMETEGGRGFSIDFHSFKPVVDADVESLTPSEIARISLQQRNNMLALINSDVNIEQVYERVASQSGKRIYVLDRANAPELFDLAEGFDFMTADEANAQLEYDAAQSGLNVWELLPMNSIYRKKRTQDLSIIPEDELAYATIRMEEIKEGADFVLDSRPGKPLASNLLREKQVGIGSKRGRKKKGDSPTYGDMKSSDYINMPIGISEEEALSLSDRAVFGKNRHEALKLAAERLGISVHTLKNNMVSKAILYDRTKSGEAVWVIRDKKGNTLKDAEGNAVALVQNQIGGPLGAVGFDDSMLSSHISGESASSLTDLPEWAAYVAIDIALRAPDNTLRSPKTIEMFFRYVNEYYTQNKSAGNNYKNDLIDAINNALRSQIGVATKSYQTTRGINVDTKKYSRFERILNDRKLKNAPGIKVKKNRIKIQDEQGLMAFLDFMSNLPEHVNDQIGFEGRQRFIQKVVKNMKAKNHDGFLSKEEILETMNDPRFNDLGSEGTGRIVTTYVARTPGLTTERMDDTTGENFNNGFPIAVMAESMDDVVYALYENASDADVIYNPEKEIGQTRFGQHGQQESRLARGSQALKSRRLGGRVYTEGNSAWEKSTPTPYGEKLEYVTRRLQDKYSDVMLLQQDIEVFKGERVPESQDFEMAIDLFYGKVREDMEALSREIEKIGKSLERVGATPEDLSDLLYALHAKERNAHIAKKRSDLEAGSGMTDEEADAIIDELMSPEIMESVNMVYDIVENTRRTMVEGGLESRETIEHWQSLFKNYVPLSGLAADEQSEESNSYPTGGGGFSVYGKSSKKAKGRKSRTGTNIVASVVAQNMAIKQRARKDEAMRSLHRLVQENPNEGVWKLYSQDSPMTRLADDGSQQKMNVAEMKAHRNMVPLRINGKQHFIFFKDMNYADALNGLTEEETGSAVKNMGKYISLLRNFATVYNPAFFIKNYMRDIGSALFNAMSEVERDGGIMTGFDLEPGKFSSQVVKTSLKVLKPLLKEGAFGLDLDPDMAEAMQEWKQAGGRTGWSYSETIKEIQEKLEKAAQDPSKTKKILKGFYQGTKVFEYIEGINEAFENAIRFAAYLEARKAGASKQRAAQLSKNITVNFNRSGEASSSYNSMYLFFNAAAQSAARFTRTMATPKASLPGQNGQADSWFNRAPAPAKLAGGIVAFEVMKTMFNIAMSGEDESGELYYNTIPDYIKERNSIIFYGDGPSDYITLPIPYGYNMFNNLGLTIGEISSGQRDLVEGGVFLGMGAMNSFSPLGFGQGSNVIERLGLGFLPTALRFPVDLYANTSFTGNRIIREQYPFGAPVPEWTLSFRSPEVVKEMARYLNKITGGTENVSGDIDINPDPYAYLISSYTAGLGKTVGQVANLSRIGYEMAKRKAIRLQNVETSDQFVEELFTMREEDTVPIERRDIPFINILYGSENKYYSYDVFTENINELGQYKREIEAGETDAEGLNFVGVQQLNDILRGTKERLEMIRDAKQRAQKIEDYIDRINAIHQLTEAELVEIREFNKAYYELRGQYIDPRSRNAITNAL